MTREEAVALLERYSNYDGMGIPNLAGCKEAMKVAVDALKEAFPELTESEDERIKKIITDSVFYQYGAGVEYKDVLDYLDKLEKQKEQKPAEWDKLQEDFRNINEAFEDGKKEVVAHPEKYDLCQPAEWSEEDEEKLKAICTYLRDYPRLAKLGDKLRFNEYSDFLKSLRQRVCKDSLQPSWKPSEVCYGPTGDPDPAGVWKPSEEQMKAMSYFVRKHQATANHATTKWPEFEAFKSLYNDLKKLM